MIVKAWEYFFWFLDFSSLGCVKVEVFQELMLLDFLLPYAQMF